MRSAAARIILKVFILLACIACVITKALTDQKARRVFLRNQKLSREWGLLHNLFWSSSGNAFANVTYGGFTLVTLLMLISRFIDAKSRPSLVEKIFITVGMLCFFAMGGMVFAALDQVPLDLHINAIILGVLSFIVGILMIIDLADPMARLINDTTQTENISINSGTVQGSPSIIENRESVVKPTVVTINGHLPNGDQDNQNHQSHHLNHSEATSKSPKAQMSNLSSESIQPQQHQPHYHQQYIQNDHAQDHIDNITRNGNYHRNTDEIEFVHAKILPSVQQPVFEKILLPEKQRPTYKVIPDPNISNSRTEYLQTSSAPSEYLPTYHQEPYRRIAHAPQSSYHHNTAYDYDYSPPKTPEIDTRSRYSYDGKRLMVIRDYSKGSRNASGTMISNRSQDTARYSGRSRTNRQCRYDEVDEEIYDRRVAAVSTIQPGFVANAAKLWDKRAKQPDDFNTIV